MTTKIQWPLLKSGEQVGLGDLVHQFLDPSGKYINCSRCKARQQALNAILTFSGPAQTPPAQQVPVEKPLPSEEQLPDSLW